VAHRDHIRDLRSDQQGDRISDDWRCGRCWRRHWETSLRFVSSLVMEVDREVRLSLKAATQEERNSFANVVEPTGWPSRQKPFHDLIFFHDSGMSSYIRI